MYKYYKDCEKFKKDFYWHIHKMNTFIRSIDADTLWIFECCIVSDPAASELEIFFHSADKSKKLSILGIKTGNAYDFKSFKIQ